MTDKNKILKISTFTEVTYPLPTYYHILMEKIYRKQTAFLAQLLMPYFSFVDKYYIIQREYAHLTLEYAIIALSSTKETLQRTEIEWHEIYQTWGHTFRRATRRKLSYSGQLCDTDHARIMSVLRIIKNNPDGFLTLDRLEKAMYMVISAAENRISNEPRPELHHSLTGGILLPGGSRQPFECFVSKDIDLRKKNKLLMNYYA